jgi:hypothetical protein
MLRSRRYLFVFGLLALAAVVALSWQLLRPLFAEAEMVDAGALDDLKGATLTPAAPAGSDWPQYRGPNRDGVAAAGRFNTNWEAKPPAVVWKSACGGGYGSVAVADGRVYVQDKQAGEERLVCVNAANGSQLWADSYPADYKTFAAGYADGPKATPTIHDGRAYTVGAVGQFRCVKLNGDSPPQLLWQHDLPAEFASDLKAEPLRWGYAGSPLVEGDLVIVPAGGRDGSIVAFDKISGEKRWAVGKSLGAYSSPVVGTFGGVRQVVAMTGDSVLGIAVPDGKLLWEHPWKTQYGVNAASPVVAGDYVFVSSDYGKGCAVLRVGAGSVRPVFVKPGAKGLKSWHGTAVHRDGFVYGFDSTRLKCMSLREGTLVPDWDAPGIEKGGVLLVGDKLLVQAGSGTLLLLDADPNGATTRGTLKGACGPNSWATPAVVGGRIFTRDAANVVCVDCSN